MDCPPNLVEEAAESFNSREQGLSAFDPSESVRGESNVPNYDYLHPHTRPDPEAEPDPGRDPLFESNFFFFCQ